MKNMELYDKIKSYLDGELSQAEKAEFENEMSTNPSFAEDVRIFKFSREHLLPLLEKEDELKDFRKIIEQKGEEYFPTNKDLVDHEIPEEVKEAPTIPTPSLFVRFKRSKFAKPLAVAASVLLLIGFVNLKQIWFPNYSNDSITLYNTYHKVPQADFAVLGSQKTPAEIDLQFNAKEYEKTIGLIDKYLENSGKNKLKALYFKGLCLQELNKHNEAIKVFENISREQSIYKYNSIWYMALSYLHEGEEDYAINQLESIPNGVGKYNSAQRLLKELHEEND